MEVLMKIEVGTDRNLQNRALLGVMLMLAGLALYPLSDAFVKHLMGTYSVHQTLFLRALTRAIPLLIAIQFQGGFTKVLSTNRVSSHAIRLLVNLFYTAAFMYAFSVSSL